MPLGKLESEYFTSPLQPAYQRNRNSRSKTKNLRCFPCCSIPGKHNKNGFCGQCVDVHIPCNVLGVYNDLYAIAVFTTVSTLADTEDDLILPSRESDESQIRSKINPCAQWIRVKCTTQSDGVICFKINPELLGWHYDWRSNKNTRHTKHCLRLFIFDKFPDGTLNLKFAVDSPSFELYSGNHKVEEDDSVEEAYNGKRKVKRFGSVAIEESSEDSGSFAVLSRQKLETSSAQTSSYAEDISIRKLLENALKSVRTRTLQRSPLFKKEEDYTEDQIPFIDEIKLEDNEAFKLIESLLDDETFLATVSARSSQNLLDEISEDEEPSNAVIESIIATLSSDDLNDELRHFLEECSNGPMGSSLCECLHKTDDLEMNPFLLEFSRSLFKKFQTIIARHLETDLFNNGLIPSCSLSGGKRGTHLSTTKAFENDDEDKNLVFDPKDMNVLYRFMKVIQAYNAKPNLAKLIRSADNLDPSNPFRIVNKKWVDAGNIEWFEDIMYHELGLIDICLARLLKRAHSIKLAYVTEERFLAEGPNILSFHNVMEFCADGKLHRVDDISPLFHYLEAPVRHYVFQHEILADGSYRQEWCLWLNKEEIGKVVYIYNNGLIRKSEENRLVLTRRCIIMDEPLPTDNILAYCSQKSPPGLLGRPDYEFCYLAEPL